MNKIIWMCWFQGETDKNMPLLNQECIKRWKDLNPDWEVKVLSYDNIAEYTPEFFKVKSKNGRPHPPNVQANLLRKMLLSKYGGMWVDASLYPMIPVSDFYDKIVNETEFFSYRFFPRKEDKDGIREIENWFLVAKEPHNYLIDTWLEEYKNFYSSVGPKHWSKNPFYRDHMILCKLYDTDEKIKYIVDNMAQISEERPHSRRKPDGRKVYESFVYKRPYDWHPDGVRGWFGPGHSKYGKYDNDDLDVKIRKLREIEVSISPTQNFSFDIMRVGVKQHIDRAYTYDVIPNDLIGGVLLQNVHRLKQRTEIKFLCKEECIVYFFFHPRKDGGYSEIFKGMNTWEKCEEFPKYDVHNPGHGLHMEMYRRNISPHEEIVIPPTTEKDACCNLVFKRYEK